MSRIIVTGATGFLGARVARYLLTQGHEVLGWYLTEPRRGNVEFPGEIALERVDVTNAHQVTNSVEKFRPEAVYHFAGQAYVVPSWRDPAATFDVNLLGTLHLLEALRRHVPRCAVGFAGSGTEYGDAEQVPTPEDAPLLPTSPYATSKVAADLLCYQYFRSHGLPTFRYRIFGTTGVGKLGDVCNDFASQIARAEVGDGVIRVGDLTKRRDIMDVRDAVVAMERIVTRGEPGGVYNIGSGVAPPISDILDQLKAMAHAPISVVADPTRHRLVDEPVHLGDTRRVRGLGWVPSIPMSQTLRDILESWRQQQTRLAAVADTH